MFQALQHTLGLVPEQWRILDEAHNTRSLAEYEGYAEVDEHLLAEILKVADIIRKKVAALDPIQQ